MTGDRDADDPAAGAHVGHRHRLPGTARLDVVERRDHQKLGLGPRNEHVGRDAKIERVELALADQVRHRHAFGPAAHQLAELRAQLFGGRLGEARIEFDPPAFAGVGQQDLGF